MGLYSGVITTVRQPRSLASICQWASGILFSTKFLPQCVLNLVNRASFISMSEVCTPDQYGCAGFWSPCQV